VRNLSELTELGKMYLWGRWGNCKHQPRRQLRRTKRQQQWLSSL